MSPLYIEDCRHELLRAKDTLVLLKLDENPWESVSS